LGKEEEEEDEEATAEMTMDYYWCWVLRWLALFSGRQPRNARFI